MRLTDSDSEYPLIKVPHSRVHMFKLSMSGLLMLLPSLLLMRDLLSEAAVYPFQVV
jgi:hypothetical protein